MKNNVYLSIIVGLSFFGLNGSDSDSMKGGNQKSSDEKKPSKFSKVYDYAKDVGCDFGKKAWTGKRAVSYPQGTAVDPVTRDIMTPNATRTSYSPSGKQIPLQDIMGKDIEIAISKEDKDLVFNETENGMNDNPNLGRLKERLEYDEAVWLNNERKIVLSLAAGIALYYYREPVKKAVGSMIDTAGDIASRVVYRISGILSRWFPLVTKK